MAQSQNQNLNATPHPIIVAAVDFFTPEHHREYVVGDLCGKGLSSTRYLIKGAECVAGFVLGQLWRAFNPTLFILELAALALAFAGVPFGQPFVIAVAGALFGLALRDAYVYPTRKGPFHEGLDAAYGLLFLFFLELFEMRFAPASAIPLEPLLRAIALGLLTVSMVRIGLRRPPKMQPFGIPSYRSTLFVTFAWLGALLVVQYNSLPLLPQVFLKQDVLLMFTALVSFGFAFRLRKDALNSSVSYEHITIGQDYETKKLERQRDRLWTSLATKPSEIGHLVLEVFGLLMFGLPAVITLVRWSLGLIPSSEMDWLVFGSLWFGLLSAWAVWFAVRNVNQNMVRLLEERIAGRKGK